MSRKPSDATLLRTARSEIKSLKVLQAQLIIERNQYRERATKAEQEASEWRRRFDLLLVRSPVAEPSGPDDRMERCIALLRLNPGENYVPSIKLYRELFGSSLVDAKNAMERERDRLGTATNG